MVLPLFLAATVLHPAATEPHPAATALHPAAMVHPATEPLYLVGFPTPLQQLLMAVAWICLPCSQLLLSLLWVRLLHCKKYNPKWCKSAIDF